MAKTSRKVKLFRMAELAINVLDDRHIENDIKQRENAAAQLESQRIGLLGEIEIGESGLEAGDIRFQFKASHIETLRSGLKLLKDDFKICLNQKS